VIEVTEREDVIVLMIFGKILIGFESAFKSATSSVVIFGKPER